jgi:hypothetical protein
MTLFVVIAERPGEQLLTASTHRLVHGGSVAVVKPSNEVLIS